MLQDRIISYEGNKYGNRDIHNHLLPFLEKFDKHCVKYKIPYSLAFGSALGCVRSNGFIPWDDDVDVVMKRVDYERFFETLKNKETNFSKICRVECPKHLCKLCDDTAPIVVDVYPADRVPNGWIMSHLKLVAVQTLKNIIIGRCGRKKTFFRKARKIVAYVISFPFSVEELRKCFQLICKWGNNCPTNKISCYSTGWGDMGKYFPPNIFDNIEYRKFEDIQLPVVVDYNSYLTIEFGDDYMTPPKEEERISNHNIRRQ